MTDRPSPPGRRPRPQDQHDQHNPHDQHDQHNQHNPQDRHDQHNPDGRHGTHGHPRHHRPGRGNRGVRFAALLTDQPIGTSPDALVEAYLGIGQLLRARARGQSRWQRRTGGLTFARSALLAALDADFPQRMGELAHRLGVVPRTVTPMVDALEADGLLERESDPADRRATLLRITAAGTAELARTRSDRQSTLDEVFAVLSDSDRAALAAILESLRAAAREGMEPTEAGSDEPVDDAAVQSPAGFPGPRPFGRPPRRRQHHGRTPGEHHGWHPRGVR